MIRSISSSQAYPIIFYASSAYITASLGSWLWAESLLTMPEKRVAIYLVFYSLFFSSALGVLFWKSKVIALIQFISVFAFCTLLHNLYLSYEATLWVCLSLIILLHKPLGPKDSIWENAGVAVSSYLMFNSASIFLSLINSKQDFFAYLNTLREGFYYTSVVGFKASMSRDFLASLGTFWSFFYCVLLILFLIPNSHKKRGIFPYVPLLGLLIISCSNAYFFHQSTEFLLVLALPPLLKNIFDTFFQSTRIQ